MEEYFPILNRLEVLVKGGQLSVLGNALIARAKRANLTKSGRESVRGGDKSDATLDERKHTEERLSDLKRRKVGVKFRQLPKGYHLIFDNDGYVVDKDRYRVGKHRRFIPPEEPIDYTGNFKDLDAELRRDSKLLKRMGFDIKYEGEDRSE